MIPSGRYLLGTPVDMKGKPVVVAAESAFNAYVRETGANYSGNQAAAPGGAGGELDPKRLHRLAKQARRLLGPHLRNLADADRRGPLLSAGLAQVACKVLLVQWQSRHSNDHTEGRRRPRR